MGKISGVKLILITPIFIVITHALAMLPHEYAHSFMAWGLGYKSNPFALQYGDISWQNLLFLVKMDENVNYNMIFSSKHGIHAAIIAFAGAGIANVILFILSFLCLRNPKIKQLPYLLYFIFLFNLMNLGNFYDYVPIRTIAPYDGGNDVATFVKGLDISPWWVYIIGGYIVAFLIWQFFTRTLILAYVNLEISNIFSKAFIMISCVVFLFGFYGMPGGIPGLFEYGDVSFCLSITSIAAIPGIIVAAWPTRIWVKTEEKRYF